jgi:hypothetical protein
MKETCSLIVMSGEVYQVTWEVSWVMKRGMSSDLEK